MYCYFCTFLFLLCGYLFILCDYLFILCGYLFILCDYLFILCDYLFILCDVQPSMGGGSRCNTHVHLLFLFSAWMGACLNCLVHVVMYSYYGLAVIPALREKLWWKKYITTFQLVSIGFK